MNTRNMCTNKSALKNKQKNPPQQSSLMSLQIQIQIQKRQEKKLGEKKKTGNAWL